MKRLLLTAVALSSVACASSSQTAELGWPAQPSPAYPSPSGEPAPSPTTVVKTPQTSGSSASPLAKTYADHNALDTQEGKATYYADSLAGNHTASGELYDPTLHSAAHKKLPFGTIVRVVRTDNGAVTYAKINDRGPFGPSDRIIDLSKSAANELDMLRAGVVPVRVEILEQPAKKK